MTNIIVNEFKIKLDENEYTFRLDFRSLLKFTKTYDDAIIIFNEFLSGKNIYDCIVKILSCSCVEQEWSEEELASRLSFNFKTMKLMDEITFALVEGILLEEEKGTKKGKNPKTSQSLKNG